MLLFVSATPIYQNALFAFDLPVCVCVCVCVYLMYLCMKYTRTHTPLCLHILPHVTIRKLLRMNYVVNWFTEIS